MSSGHHRGGWEAHGLDIGPAVAPLTVRGGQ
jgi:hypothetical protein